MNKSFLFVLFLFGFAMTLCADITSDMAVASDLAKQDNFVAAKAAYEKILSDYADATPDNIAIVKCSIGRILIGQRKYSDAQGMLGNISFDGVSHSISNAVRYYYGLSLSIQDKHDEALDVYRGILETHNESTETFLSMVKFELGKTYEKLNRNGEAQEAYIQAATSFGFISLSFQEKCYEKIKPHLLSKEVYKNYLNKILMIVPVNESNTIFLGKIKSQVDILN